MRHILTQTRQQHQRQLTWLRNGPTPRTTICGAAPTGIDLNRREAERMSLAQRREWMVCDGCYSSIGPVCTCCGSSATTTEEDCRFHTDPDIEQEAVDHGKTIGRSRR